MQKRRSIILVLISFSLFMTSCKKTDKQPVKNNLETIPVKTTALIVNTVSARHGTLSVVRDASATVSAQKDSRVATSAGGVVRSLLVREGQKVEANEAVMQLDDTGQMQALENAKLQAEQASVSLLQARQTATRATVSLMASLKSAEAALEQAKSYAKSMEDLASLGGTSRSDLQAAYSQLAQAQSAAEQAKQNIDQNGNSNQNSIPIQQAQLRSAQAAVRQAQVNLERTTVRAPFAGTVASLLVQQGENAAAGSAVVRLVQSGYLRANFSVPSTDAENLPKGKIFNLAYGGKNYVGRVIDSSGIAGTNRLVPIKAVIEGGVDLPVGATARANYRVTLGEGVLIPSSAVRASSEGNEVFLAMAGVATRRLVSVSSEADSQVVVSGIKEGDSVISPLPGSIQGGSSVQVQRVTP